jgi:lysine 6-dehydrogenase
VSGNGDIGGYVRLAVLGAGRVGSAIAKDLCQEPEFAVQVVDVDPERLGELEGYPLETIQADLRTGEGVATAVQGCDLIVCAVPGHMGFQAVRRVLLASKNVIDISFFPEDAFLLDDLARQRGVTAVVDCGIAPGLCNLIAGHVETRLDQLELYRCYVGGLPKVRRWPYEYQAVFSPVDVIEEYTRPARLVQHGKQVTRPALSDVELRDVPGVGTLEAFNTDGLRTLIRTLDCPSMVEKTLRYPGHAALMRVLRESGFFSQKPVELGTQTIRPIDLTVKLLAQQWALDAEGDLTVMQVVVQGTKGAKRYTYTYDLLDRYDPITKTTSMARTTGYTCAIVARQVASGLFSRVGICPPEYVGRVEDCYCHLLAEYRKRGIVLTEQVIEHEGG